MAQFFPHGLFRPWFILILIVLGFFLLLFIILHFDLIPQLDSDSDFGSVLQKYGNMEAKYQSDALGKLKATVDYHVQNGEDEKTLPFLNMAYTLEAKMFGPEHAQTLNTLEMLASLNFHLEKYEEGLALYWRLYKIQKKNLGPTHSDTLSTLQQLGHVYHFQGRYEKAQGFFKDVYNQRKLLLGPEHTETMQALATLGSAIFEADQNPNNTRTIQKILPYFRKVHKVYNRTLGENNFRTLTVLFEIGKFLAVLKQFDEAISTFQTIMKAAEKRPQSQLYENAETWLSSALLELGRTEEARLVHVKARRVKNRKGKETHDYVSKVLERGKLTPEVADQTFSVLNLAKVAMAEENYEKALENLEELYDIVENDHPKRKDVLQSFMEVHGTLGNFKKAFEISIEFFHVVQNGKTSDYYKNEEIASAWQNVFSLYLKVAEEHPDEDEQDFRPKLKQVSQVLVAKLELELEFKKGDKENPGILKAFSMALIYFDDDFGKSEMAVLVTSKTLQVLKKIRDAEPKPNEEEMKSIHTDIKEFQKFLDKEQHSERGTKYEIPKQLFKDEL